MKSSNIPNAIKRGIQDQGFERYTDQQLVDQLGFFYRKGAFDLERNRVDIYSLDSCLAALTTLFQERVDPYHYIQLQFPLCTFTFNCFEGVTQLIINRFAPVDPSYFEKFLTDAQLQALPKRLKICGALEYPLIDIGIIGDKVEFKPGRELTAIEREVLTPEMYQLFLGVSSKSATLIKQLASKEAGEMLVVSYEPGAQLHVAELPIGDDGGGHHHVDHNQNAVTRSIGLIGEMQCHIGTSDENSVQVLRVAGDEIIMNYLAEGFGATQPFHDFSNNSGCRTLSLVIDEGPQQGLDLLNRLGVYNRAQTAAICF